MLRVPVLMVFKRTRRAGTVMFVAICLGALATNIVLTHSSRGRGRSVVRAFLDWWRSPAPRPMDGFPRSSGHMTAASAVMAAPGRWRIGIGRQCWAARSSWVNRGAARCYLVVHYPTPTCWPAFVALAAVAAQLLVSFAFRRYGERRFARPRHACAPVRRRR